MVTLENIDALLSLLRLYSTWDSPIHSSVATIVVQNNIRLKKAGIFFETLAYAQAHLTAHSLGKQSATRLS